MGLEINQVSAKIGIERIPSRVESETVFAKLELHQKHARVNIHSELPKVTIDQYEAFASAGLKNNYDLVKEITDRTHQQVLERIGQIAEDGDRLAAIELGGNPIADIAERDAYTQHEFGLATIPTAGPKFDVTGGRIQFDPEPNGEGVHNGVEANYIPGYVNINFTPAVIKIYMERYASIKFNYKPDKIDTYV